MSGADVPFRRIRPCTVRRLALMESAHPSELLNDCTVLDVSEPTTQHYADIVGELKRKGKPIPTNDIWTAALCRQHSLPLLSRDRHFDLVEGNDRIEW